MDNNHQDRVRRGDYEIDLKFFVTVLGKCWIFLLLAAVVVGLAAGVYTSFFIPKKYSSTVKMYVDPNAQSSAGSLNNSTADALAETYPPVLRHSDEFAQRVALAMAKLQRDGEPMFPQWTYRNVGTETAPIHVADNWSRVRGMMSTGIMDTKIFYITISSTDPEEAYEMAKIAAEIAPEVLNGTVQIGIAKVIGQPMLDTVEDSPNLSRNIILAALVAVVLVYVAFFLRDLFDTTVYAVEDLLRFELPVLGAVPTFPNADGHTPFRKNDKEGRKL